MCTSFIRRHINALAVNQLFTTRDYLSFGRRAAVDQALYRLVKAGAIIRLARGVFARAGSQIPTAMAVAAVKARAFGRAVARHAADLAQEIGLTLEGNNDPTICVSRSSSSFRFGDTVIHLRATGPRKMHLGDSKSGSVIRALWHIGKTACTGKKIATALRYLGRREREEIRQSARWMPAWLSDRLCIR